MTISDEMASAAGLGTVVNVQVLPWDGRGNTWMSLKLASASKGARVE